jgi:hypothetical protein
VFFYLWYSQGNKAQSVDSSAMILGTSVLREKTIYVNSAILASRSPFFLKVINVPCEMHFVEMGYPRPLHQTDAYGLFLLTLFRVHEYLKYSLAVTKGGHMNHPTKNMAMLNHL